MTFSNNIDVRVEELAFENLLDRLGLGEMWRYIQTNNPSGEAPYHNNQHLFHVARIANTLLLNSGYSDVHVQRVLLTACLWHDYNHGMGQCSDSLNITNAVMGLEQYVAQGNLIGFNPNRTVMKDIIRLMEITEFPFKSDPISIMARCIRDADLLYGVSLDRVEQVMEGLRAEMSQGKPIDLTQMYNKQFAFYNVAKMYTTLGELIWKETAPLALQAKLNYSIQHTNHVSNKECLAS